MNETENLVEAVVKATRLHARAPNAVSAIEGRNRMEAAKAALLAHVDGLLAELSDARAACPACHESEYYRDATGERVLPLKKHKDSCELEKLRAENERLKGQVALMQQEVNGLVDHRYLLADEKAKLEQENAALKAALNDLVVEIGPCRCHEAFTSRRLNDPACQFHQYDHILTERLKAALEG